LGDPILDLLQLLPALCFLLLQFGQPLSLRLTALGRFDALLDFVEALLRLCHRALLRLPLSLQPLFGGLKVRSGRRRWRRWHSHRCRRLRWGHRLKAMRHYPLLGLAQVLLDGSRVMAARWYRTPRWRQWGRRLRSRRGHTCDLGRLLSKQLALLRDAGRGEFALRIRCVLLSSPLEAAAAPCGFAAFSPFLRAFFTATLGLFLATLAVFEASGALLFACLLALLFRIRWSCRCSHRSRWSRNGQRRGRR
jgi:hypothetical protein